MAAGDEIKDAYGLARALLTSRGPEDQGLSTAEPALEHFSSKSLHNSLWEALAEEAEYHGVAPLLEPMVHLLSRQMRIPEQVKRAFVALASRHRRAAVTRESCIDELLESFTTAGVRFILLKGAALAHRIYTHPGLRPMVDIDVLIDPAHTERAVNTATRLGYSFASRPASPFARRMHHLPVATLTRSGFRVALEIHVNAVSPNQAVRLTFATLAEKPQIFRRGSGPSGIALGHTDMLRHLSHHAFEPASRVRLIHLYDLWRYRAAFRNEIDWDRLDTLAPEVAIILRLISYVFSNGRPASGIPSAEPVPAGVGLGMLPLSEIATKERFVDKLAALLNPPAWWLHGFYGIAPERSLVACRTVRHPARVAQWLVQRLISRGAGLLSDERLHEAGHGATTAHSNRSCSHTHA